MQKKHMLYPFIISLAALIATNAYADGIVSKIVNSPLSANGLLKGNGIGINILLQSDEAQGLEFMNPEVIGYGIPAGGRIEIELGGGFERIPEIELTQKTIMVVTGAPQQGMPGNKVGYTVGEGSSPSIYTITPTDAAGLTAENLMTPAPGAAGDPVRNRGIKVFHIGLIESAFKNSGNGGTATVRIIDGDGSVLSEGTASVDFQDQSVPQLQPNNFPDAQRNHNWQKVASGKTLGKSHDTLPLPVMLYDHAGQTDAAGFKSGMIGVGVLSTQQLKAMEFEKPAAISRYNGGLIVQDSNGDGQLDPNSDRIIGGVIGKAPAGAMGQELRSLDVHGAIDLSSPSSAYNARFGQIFGGAVMLLQFTAGDKSGLYRPTLALLSDPDNIQSEDGSSYTFTIVVE